MNLRKGTSFIDIIISLGIIAALFWGIYLVYFSLIDSVSNIEARTAATAAVNQEMEIIRDLPYGIIGTVGGVPAGVIEPQRTVSIDRYNFLVTTIVRNIDDPYDGIIPDDTAPADYKFVQFDVNCSTCARFVPLSFSTVIAPKNLETASTTGSLFVNIINSQGIGIGDATVRVTNATVTPQIDLTDITNASGVLQLVGIQSSTQSYHIEVSKGGYSSDKTYPLGAAGNPNPVTPDATVASRAETTVSFAIDMLSKLTVFTSDEFCAPAGNRPFTISGSKLIGYPSVLKFNTSSVTDANGSFVFPNIEWDTYSLSLSGSSYDVLGTIPFSPIAINPTSTVDFRFVVRPTQADSLLVSIYDAATGSVIPGATISLAGPSSQTLVTGRAMATDTDWSGGNFTSQSGGIDAISVPGSLKLLVNASGTYDTVGASHLISRTIDVGSSTANYYSLSWNPVSQPAPTGVGSAAFQLAANNDSSTWNFVGPDGTAGTYYTASSTLVGLDNNRYVRYKVFLSTQDENFTPTITDVTLELYSACVPPSQALFSNLGAGTYNVDVTAPQYFENSSSIDVVGAWQELTIPLTHQ